MHTYLLDLFLKYSEVATDWIIALSCLGFSVSAVIIGARVLKLLEALCLPHILRTTPLCRIKKIKAFLGATRGPHDRA